MLDAAPAVRQRQRQRSVRLRADPGSDAAIRVFAEQQQAESNIGIGAYDLPERAFTQDNNRYTFRALEAGPIGRRIFINTRFTMTWMDFGSRSADRGAHNHRAGCVQQRRRAAGRPRPRQESDVRVGHGLRSRHAFLARRRPDVRRLVSRQSQQQLSGNLRVQQTAPRSRRARRSSTRAASAIRRSTSFTRGSARTSRTTSVKKGLTLSPGVRTATRRTSTDTLAFEPRLGITWAPTKSGKTTLRASGGIFHGWLDPGIWWQTVRFDGGISATSSSAIRRIPIPGVERHRCPANTYRLGDVQAEQELAIQRRHRSAVLAARQRQRAVQLLPSGSAAARHESQPADQRRAARSGVCKHHLDGDRRGDHPARAVREFQSQSGRAVAGDEPRRHSTGAGWR